jgi:hypothetical protein
MTEYAKRRIVMKGEFTQKGKEAMERFKMESANEVGVNLKQGYNGDLTARQAGSIGGQMVKKMMPILTTKLCRSYRPQGAQISFNVFLVL